MRDVIINRDAMLMIMVFFKIEKKIRCVIKIKMSVKQNNKVYVTGYLDNVNETCEIFKKMGYNLFSHNPLVINENCGEKQQKEYIQLILNGVRDADLIIIVNNNEPESCVNIGVTIGVCLSLNKEVWFISNKLNTNSVFFQNCELPIIRFNDWFEVYSEL